MADPKELLYAALSRTAAPSGSTDVGKLVDMLGGTRAASQALGISQRTVQRWTTTTGRRSTPRSDRRDHLVNAARTSPAARAQALNDRRRSRIRNSGATVQVDGYVGPVMGKDYRQWRKITFKFTGGNLTPVIDAWLAGDDTAALAALNVAFDREYSGTDGWTMDDLNALNFLR